MEDSSYEHTYYLDLKTSQILLIPDYMDDFALKEFTRTQAEDLYELIDQRYHSGSMIVTANHSPKDWYSLFPKLVLGVQVALRVSDDIYRLSYIRDTSL